MDLEVNIHKTSDCFNYLTPSEESLTGENFAAIVIENKGSHINLFFDKKNVGTLNKVIDCALRARNFINNEKENDTTSNEN